MEEYVLIKDAVDRYPLSKKNIEQLMLQGRIQHFPTSMGTLLREKDIQEICADIPEVPLYSAYLRDLRVMFDDGRGVSRLFLKYAKLVVKTAHVYTRPAYNLGYSINDLIQAGNLGLLHAINRSKTTRFFLQAAHSAIRRAMCSMLCEENLVVHPKYSGNILINMREDERTVAVEQFIPQSLVQLHEEATEQSATDVVLDNESLEEILGSLLESLKPREADILILRYGLIDGWPRLGNEIGKIFNICSARVHQIEHKALRKLRRNSRKKLLEPFIDVAPEWKPTTLTQVAQGKESRLKRPLYIWEWQRLQRMSEWELRQEMKNDQKERSTKPFSGLLGSRW